MKKIAIGLALLFSTVLTTSTFADNTKTVELAPSSSLQVKGNHHIQIKQVPKLHSTKVKITGNQELIEALIIEGSKKSIKILSRSKFHRSPPLLIEIESRGIRNLHSKGNNKIQISDIDMPELNIDTEGNNQIMLSGKTGELNGYFSGNTLFQAQNLIAKEADIDARGNNDIQIHVTDRLERNLTGHSKLSIKGKPRITGNTRGTLEIVAN